jgi:Toprim domain-containing protein/CHC2-type zinc finger protein
MARGAPAVSIPAHLIVLARSTPIESVVEARGIRLRGGNERVGPCPLCRGGYDRFGVSVVKQVFNCRQCGAKGGVIDLVMALDDCTFREAIETLAGETIESSSRSSSPPSLAPKVMDDRSSEIVRKIVSEIVPLTGTAGETYLRDIRKINVEAIRDVLDRTDAVGWHPACYFKEPGDPARGVPAHPLHGRNLGAIIAIMTDPVTAAPTGAISRTYLAAGMKVMKAKTLSSPRGVVRLSPDDEVLEGLHLAEGLETGLSAMSLGWRPTWATGDCGLLAAFPVLPAIGALTVFVDRDPAGERAAEELASRWRAAGREVILFYPRGGDLNDALKEMPA